MQFWGRHTALFSNIMFCLTAFGLTYCSLIPGSGADFVFVFKAPCHSLSLPPSSLLLFLLRMMFPTSVALPGRLSPWQSTPPLETSSDLIRFKLVLSSHLPIFKEGDSPSHIYRMMWCCRVQVPKLMDAVVEEAGSTYNPTWHPIHYHIKQYSNALLASSQGLDPITTAWDYPPKQKYFSSHSTWQDSQWQTCSAGHSERINQGRTPHLRSENLPGVRPTNSFQSATGYSVAAGSSRLAHFLSWSGHPHVLSVSFSFCWSSEHCNLNKKQQNCAGCPQQAISLGPHVLKRHH